MAPMSRKVGETFDKLRVGYGATPFHPSAGPETAVFQKLSGLPRAIAMTNFHPISATAKTPANFLGDHYRAMLASGAAERNR
jgi:hypothetical protein